jgi:hypothetical protein
MATRITSYADLKYFKGVSFQTPIETIKKTYLGLVKVNHPDMGGDVAVMATINAEWDFLKLHNFNVHVSKEGDVYTDEREERADSVTDRFVDIVEVLIHLDGILIEIIGSWLWVSGDTFPHKDAIKEAGGRWQKRKRAWYFAPEGFKPKRRAAVASLDEIRGAYGSKTVADNRGRKTERLAIAS